MAQHDGVEVLQGTSQQPGVVEQQLRLARVKEHAATAEFDEERQSVLGFQATRVDRVLNQNSDAEVVIHWD